MMSLSPALGKLWKQDANQPLWTLMAKAWTLIRDQVGSVEAPRDEFFKILCPALHIPSPATYLEDHGWKVDLNEAGVAVLMRIPDAPPVQSLVNAGLVDPTLSVHDLISYAKDSGYAVNYKPEHNTTSSTFLGLSSQQDTKQADHQQVPAHAMVSDHDIRVAEKKKRRAKQQTGNKSSAVQSLQAQIAVAHDVNTYNNGPAYEPRFIDEESAQIYDNIAALMIANLTQQDTETARSTSNTVAQPVENPMNDPVMPGWKPFRLGADEDVTLPQFDPAYV